MVTDSGIGLGASQGPPLAPIKDILTGKTKGEVTIRGWIYRTRSSGGICFITIRDSTGILQCTVKKGNVPDDVFADAGKALIESSIILWGDVNEDKRAPGGFELRAKGLRVVHFAETYPITKDQSDEWLLDNRHLWVRSREMTNILRIRATFMDLIHEFMKAEGFSETHSPSFVSGACEGGSTLFEVKYFGEKVYLTQSWQLYAEALAMSLEKIYTIAPSFRAEKSRTRRHLTEYWHFEMEAAWWSNEDTMQFEERLLEFMVQRLLKERREELDLLKRDISKLEKVKAPFERVPYTKAIEIMQKNGLAIEYGADFGYEEEKVLTAVFEKPFFIVDFPTSIKPFYHRPDPDRPNVVLCHDLLAPEGYGEIVGGGERIWEKDVLEKRLSEGNIDPTPYQWYIDLRRYGSVPHSGFGMGVDRVITWICGLDHIKHVIPFPRMMRRVYP